MPGPKQNTKRTLLGNSTYIFLIRFFPAMASLLVFVAFSRHFDEQFYGSYQRFWVQFQVYSAIACLGIPALLLTYPLARIKQFIGTLSGKSTAGIGAWLVIIAVVFSLKQFFGGGYFHLVFPIVFLLVNAIIAICEAYLMVGRKFEFIAIASTSYALLFVFVHGLFRYEEITFDLLLFLLLLACVVRCIVLVVKAWRLYQQSEALEAPTHALGSVRSLWFHLGIYDVMQTVFRWADKFVLSFFLSHEVFAVYVNGTVDIPLLPIMLGAVGSALLLHLGESETSDADRIRLLQASSSKLALIVFPLFFFFVFFRYELFTVVFTHRYIAAVPLFLISSLVIPLRAYNFTSILQFKGQGRIINAGALLDIVIALALMYPMYCLWSLNGVALAFVISTYVQAIFYLWQTARVLHCSIVDLLPVRSWLVSFTVFSLVFFIGHSLLAARFNAANTLLLGCCLMGITLSVILGQQILSNRKR